MRINRKKAENYTTSTFSFSLDREMREKTSSELPGAIMLIAFQSSKNAFTTQSESVLGARPKLSSKTRFIEGKS